MTLRINNCGMLVVPPFECAWLYGDENQFKHGQGCISLKALGQRDCTIKLSYAPGGKRCSAVNKGYTIVLESHRGRKFKIEKDDSVVLLTEPLKYLKLTRGKFLKFWIAYYRGVLLLGHGEPNKDTLLICYRDESSDCADQLHIGLSCWDDHVSFFDIKVTQQVPFQVDLDAIPVGVQVIDENRRQGNHSQVRSLEDISAQVACELLDIFSALSLLQRADVLGDRIFEMAIRFTAINFEQLFDCDCLGEFFKLPAQSVRHIYTCDYLCVNEWQIFQSLLHWMYGESSLCRDIKLRKPLAEVEELLTLIKFPLFGEDKLQQLQTSCLSKAIKEHCTRALQIIKHSQKESAILDQRFINLAALQAYQQRLLTRISPDWTILLFYQYGDGNSLNSYLGTRYFQQSFVNPTICNSMKVTVSSTIQYQTDVKAVVGLNYNPVSFAQENEDGEVWWQIDIGAEHLFVCNFYCIRYDDSQDYLSNWKLLGSSDAVIWKTLREHVDEEAPQPLLNQSLSSGAAYLGWEVNSLAAQNPYRYFRLTLSKRDTQTGNRIAISNLDFYGFVTRIDW